MTGNDNVPIKGTATSDDDDFLMLRDLGVDHDTARLACEVWPRVIIRQKVKDIMNDYNAGKIKYLSKYANKSFSGEIYSMAEANAILAKSKSEDKNRQESSLRLDNKAEEKLRNDEAEAEFKTKTDELINQMTEDGMSAFVDTIKSNSLVMKFYREQGIKSMIVLSMLRIWIAQRAGITRG